MTALPCDCAPWPGRVDADGRYFRCSGDLAHVMERISEYLTSKGTKPAAAREISIDLAAHLFDQEVALHCQQSDGSGRQAEAARALDG